MLGYAADAMMSPFLLVHKSVGGRSARPRRSRLGLHLFLSIALAGSLVAGSAAMIPTTHGTLLSGREITLPQDLPTPYAVLLIGFSQKSGKGSTEWNRRLLKTSAVGNSVACYQLPMLAGAPRLVRGVIVRSMKKDTLQATHDFFLPVFDHEAEWKQLVSFDQPDETYVLLVDKKGSVIWQTRGPVSEAALKELEGHWQAK